MRSRLSVDTAIISATALSGAHNVDHLRLILDVGYFFPFNRLALVNPWASGIGALERHLLPDLAA